MAPTILIADDQESFRAAVTAFLRSKGYDVLAAADGQGALRLLHQHLPVDLVILDLAMPKLSGRDVILAMRADSRLRDVPVVVATATQSPRLQGELRPLVQAWVVKSTVSLSNFLGVVRRLLPPASAVPPPGPPRQ